MVAGHLKFMYHVGMSVFDRLKIFDAFTNAGLPEQAGRDLSDVLEEGAEGLAKKTDMDRMLDRVHLMFAEHEARMVNQMSKMMLAQSGFVVAVVGVAVAIIVVFVDR